MLIIFGLAEVVTLFTHESRGSTASATVFRCLGAAIGSLYAAGGLLVLTLKKWAAVLTIISIVAVVAGRIALVAGGFYPLSSLERTFAVVAGTAVPLAAAMFIATRWRSLK